MSQALAHGRIVEEARRVRAFFANAATFAHDGEHRPELAGALVDVRAIGDGAVLLRSVSTDSYALLVQEWELHAKAPGQSETFVPVRVDPDAIAKAIPVSRKGDAIVELGDGATRVEHTGTGKRVELEAPETWTKPYPNWRPLFHFGVTPEPLDPGLTLSDHNVRRLGAVTVPDMPDGLVSWTLHQQERGSDRKDPTFRPAVFVASVGNASRWRAAALVMPVKTERPEVRAPVANEIVASLISE